MLSKPQIDFGHKKLESCATRWKVDKQRAAEILYDLKFIHESWEWVNMDEFLMDYLNKQYSAKE